MLVQVDGFLLVFNNGVIICWQYSNSTGIRTVYYPISFPTLIIAATCIHWNDPNYANISVAYQTNSNIQLNPYPTNLKTLVGLICIGF